MERIGVDPWTVAPRTRDEAEQEELADRSLGPVVRFGGVGGWSFALESWGARGTSPLLAMKISEGTEVLAFSSTADSTSVLIYAVDGDIVCQFDGDLPHLRRGTDPDLFRPEMIDAGLISAQDGMAAENAGIYGIISMVERRFEIGLRPEDTEVGSLLSGRLRLQ
ncbi:DUF6461 domain-containing protein [Kitasatospora sp. NPDC089797]|uniref:DUF6461 domain-containing protein n=1 Tax=Kitasatospora sp. NPDC089797 TaxID=3155298 RepID=UPI00342734A9